MEKSDILIGTIYNWEGSKKDDIVTLAVRGYREKRLKGIYVDLPEEYFLDYSDIFLLSEKQFNNLFYFTLDPL